MPKPLLKCLIPKLDFVRALAVAVGAALALSSPAAAQGWNSGALESAYDDLAQYLAEMGEFSPEDWRVRVGAAVGVAPDFSGSDHYEVRGLPIFQIRYKDDVWIDPLGVRAAIWSNECCRLLAQVGISTGRSPDKESRAFLLPDVDMGVNTGFTFEGRFAKYFAFRLRARKEFAGGHGGTNLSAAVGTILTTGAMRVIPEIATEWQSEDFMEAYYGVPASATAATGYAAYDPGSDFETVAFRVTSFYDLGDSWQLIMRGEAGFLLGDAKRSPIVRQDGDSFQGLFGVGVLYEF